jgi:hypothetical protein
MAGEARAREKAYPPPCIICFAFGEASSRVVQELGGLTNVFIKPDLPVEAARNGLQSVKIAADLLQELQNRFLVRRIGELFLVYDVGLEVPEWRKDRLHLATDLLPVHPSARGKENHEGKTSDG